MATPLEPAPPELAGGLDLRLKREDVHELGAFKWRGALPVVAELAAAGHRAVVTASTGNHGAATAWAARRHGVEAIVFEPTGASETKLALLDELGASVHVAEGDFDVAKDEAQRFALQRG